MFIVKNLTDFRKTVETGVDPRLEKELIKRLFASLRKQCLRCSGLVLSRRADGAAFDSYWTLFSFFLFFSVFCVVVFYKYIAK